MPVVLPIGKAGFMTSLFERLKAFDIIHLYYPFFGTDLIVLLFKILNPGKKLVLHYEMDPVGEDWKRHLFKIYLKLFLGYIVRWSDKIGVLSFDHARNSYLSKYLPEHLNKFSELPNGVNTNYFKPAIRDIELAEKYKIKDSDKVIIFVGGLDSQHYFKGVDILLEAFSKLRSKIKDIKLLIVGDGNLKKKYQSQAKSLGISEETIFPGWISNEDLPGYYNLSDVFVLPSTARTESFGIVIAEAQACGVPVVVSNWPGSRETLKDGETGFLVNPGDVNDLANKIEKLLLDDDLRKVMGEKGRIRAVELYDWKNVIDKITEVYSNL
jgi:glycosyltransferase involved in cell wall biosynthesis